MEREITTYYKGIILLVIAATSISISNNLSTVLYDYDATPSALVLFRFLFLLVVCTGFLYYKKIPLASSRSTTLWISLAALGIAGASLALLFAFSYISISIAIITFFTFPLLVALANMVLLKAFNIYIFSITSSAFAGIILVTYANTADSQNILGLFLAFASSIFFASSYLITQHKIARISTMIIMFYTACIGIILVLFTTFLSDISLPSSDGYGALLLATLLSTSAIFLMFYTIPLVGALSGATLMNLEPIFTILIATLFLQEQLLPVQIIGMIIVVVSLMALEHYKNQQL